MFHKNTVAMLFLAAVAFIQNSAFAQTTGGELDVTIASPEDITVSVVSAEVTINAGVTSRPRGPT